VIFPLFLIFREQVYGKAFVPQLAQQWATYYWCFHYFKRIAETFLVHSFSHATMPVFNLFRNCSYYWVRLGLLTGLPHRSPRLASAGRVERRSNAVENRGFGEASWDTERESLRLVWKPFEWEAVRSVGRSHSLLFTACASAEDVRRTCVMYLKVPSCNTPSSTASHHLRLDFSAHQTKATT
jgi:hypothetical protein